MAAALAFQENSLYNKKQYARFGPGGTAFAARIVKGLNFLANQKKMVNDITSMDVDFSKWYTDIVKKAELMDYSSVKGCMIIEPYGYAIWENIQHELDDRFKATGHQNVYMPLFIPESLLQKEKDHVKGFAPEVAWVTEGGSEKLSERLCVRPTSEILFCEHYQKIINSYRDLPKLYNQWCSVVRWEKTTRPFLRSSEFLWQEGHTMHETAEEAMEETMRMLHTYEEFYKNVLAIPAVTGQKTEKEKFAGAVATYTIEPMMHNGVALQGGTSHYFGDGWAKNFGITFTGRDNTLQHPYQTSWGVSTRMIGAIIMVHGDDRGLVLPPKVAPIEAVILPIAAHKPGVLDKANEIAEQLKSAGIRVKVDDRDTYSAGWKFNEWEMKGVPARIEVGPRDIENGVITVCRRDTLEKIQLPMENVAQHIQELLEGIQQGLFEKAKAFRDAHIKDVTNMEELGEAVQDGFARAMWCGDDACELEVKARFNAKTRNMPFDQTPIGDTCVCCGKKATKLIYFGKQY